MRNHQASITCSATDGQHIRHFSLSVRICTDKATRVIVDPVPDPAPEHFTERGARTINALISVDGVKSVTAYPSELSVEVSKDLDGEALESVFLQIIKDNLFPGIVFRTQIRELFSCDSGA